MADDKRFKKRIHDGHSPVGDNIARSLLFNTKEKKKLLKRIREVRDMN